MGIFGRRPEATLPVLPDRAPVDTALFDDSIYGRADALDRALQISVAGAEHVGTPFGPGFWLEDVARWVGQLIPDPLEFHPIGSRAADALVEAIQQGVTSFDDIDRVLGIDEDAARRFGLSKGQALANLNAVENMKDLMVAMSRMDMTVMKKWFDEEAFAHRMVAYFQVARHRLEAKGLALGY